MASDVGTIKWRNDPADVRKRMSIPNLDLITRMDTSAGYRAHPFHAHPGFLEFHYLYRGFQVYRIGDTVYHLKSGDIYVTFPGQEHGSNDIGMGKDAIYYLRLAMHPATGFLGYMPVEARIVWQALDGMRRQVFRGDGGIHDRFETILGLIDRPGPLTPILVRNAVTGLIARLIDLADQDIPARTTPEIERVVSHLQSDHSLPLQEAARLSGISSSRFQHRFRDEIGVSYSEYVLRKKIEEAIALLSDGSLTMTDIALRLDFYSSQQFSSQFKKITGVSPTRFRSSFLGDEDRKALVF